jgi:hypothetical protein
MISNRSQLEVKKGERLYHLNCDPTSPLGELHDVLVEMRNHIIQVMMDRKDQEEQANKPQDIPCVDCEVLPS